MEAGKLAREIYLSTKTKDDIDQRYRDADKEWRIQNNHDLGVAIMSDKLDLISGNVFSGTANEIDAMNKPFKHDAKELKFRLQQKLGVDETQMYRKIIDDQENSYFSNAYEMSLRGDRTVTAARKRALVRTKLKEQFKGFHKAKFQNYKKVYDTENQRKVIKTLIDE